MKKLFVICLVLFISGTVFSQTLDYFANNPEWRLDVSGQPDCIFHDEIAVYVKGDTLINDTLYKNLWARTYTWYSYEPINWTGFTPDCGGPFYSDEFYGVYRQEGKKIFGTSWYDSDITLLVDYDLDVGDDVMLWGESSEVTQLDSVLIGSEYRKKFYLENAGENYSFIEGIANSQRLFGTINEAYLNITPRYICYSQNGETLHENPQNQEGDCYFNVSVNEFKQEKISIFPNPVANEINLFNSSQIERVELYNIQGKKLLTVVEDLDKIGVSFLENGVYILQMVRGNGSTVQKRFLKQ